MRRLNWSQVCLALKPVAVDLPPPGSTRYAGAEAWKAFCRALRENPELTSRGCWILLALAVLFVFRPPEPLEILASDESHVSFLVPVDREAAQNMCCLPPLRSLGRTYTVIRDRSGLPFCGLCSELLPPFQSHPRGTRITFAKAYLRHPVRIKVEKYFVIAGHSFRYGTARFTTGSVSL